MKAVTPIEFSHLAMSDSFEVEGEKAVGTARHDQSGGAVRPRGQVRKNRGLRDVRDRPVVHRRIGAALLDLFGQRDALRPRRGSRPQGELRRSEGAAPGVLPVGTCVPGWAGVASVARRTTAGGRIRPSCHPSRTSPPTERAIAIPPASPAAPSAPAEASDPPPLPPPASPARPPDPEAPPSPRFPAAALPPAPPSGAIDASEPRAPPLLPTVPAFPPTPLSLGALTRCRRPAERCDAESTEQVSWLLPRI